MTFGEDGHKAISNDELQQNLWKLFSRPQALKVASETTALLCIDLQYSNAHPDYGYGARAKDLGIDGFLKPYWDRVQNTVLPNVSRLQGAARSNNIEVIHLRLASMTRDGRDSSLRFKTMGLPTPRHTEEAQILPEVSPIEDEVVIDKVTSSAFSSTNIDRVLRNLGIRELIVTGVVTNGCVESTVRSAMEMDYGVTLVEDATAALAPQLHENAILSMSYKDAAIVSTVEAMTTLQGDAPAILVDRHETV